jgi:hypothetical protein
VTDLTVGTIRIASATLEANVQSAVLSLTVDASVDQVTEIGLTIVDERLALRRAGLLARGVAIDWGDLDLAIADVSVTSGPSGTGEARTTEGSGLGQVATVELRARPAIIRALKLRTGARTWSGMSPTDWLAAEVADAGGTLLGQPSTSGAEITRVAEADQAAQTSWDVALDKANELGYWLFHRGGGELVFATPTWLVDQAVAAGAIQAVNLAHAIGWTTDESDDDVDTPAAVSVTMTRQDAAGFRLGDAYVLEETAGLDGRYLVTRVTLDASEPDGTVTFTAPQDPAPRPPAAAGGGGGGGGGGIRIPPVALPSMQAPVSTVSGGLTRASFVQAVLAAAGPPAQRVADVLARYGIQAPNTMSGLAGWVQNSNPRAATMGDLVFALGGPNGVNGMAVVLGGGRALGTSGTIPYVPASWQAAGRIVALGGAATARPDAASRGLT